MGLFNRFMRGLETEMGMVLLGLVLVLLILTGLYLFLLYRKKQSDIFTYLHHQHYQKAQERAKEIGVDFVGEPEASFWGRRTTVKVKGEWASCTIPIPGDTDALTAQRMHTLQNALTSLHNSSLPAPQGNYSRDSILHIQTKTLTPTGRKKQTLSSFLLDHTITDTTAEKLLLDIARTLKSLHDQTDEQGKPFYHGWLTPRTILLDMDEKNVLSKPTLSETGFVYSITPQKVYLKIELLRKGTLPINVVEGKEVLEQLAYLPPELKNEESLNSLSPASDTYSFAAIATHILTGKTFTGENNVNWNEIPQQWKRYLQQSLKTDPKQRPQDLLEIEDWLLDTDLELFQGGLDGADSSGSQRYDADIRTIADKIHTLQNQPVETEAHDQVVKIKSTIKNGSWKQAKDLLKKRIAENSADADLWVDMAIVSFELNELDEAQNHYAKAKEIDPLVARRFRRHIAFKV